MVRALQPALAASRLRAKKSTEFRGSVPPERLPSPRGQFRRANSSSVSGIPRGFRNSSEVFTNSSEIPKKKTTTGNSLIFRRIPKIAVFRGCRGCRHFFFSSAEFLPSPQIRVPPNPGLNSRFYSKFLRKSVCFTAWKETPRSDCG